MTTCTRKYARHYVYCMHVHMRAYPYTRLHARTRAHIYTGEPASECISENARGPMCTSFFFYSTRSTQSKMRVSTAYETCVIICIFIIIYTCIRYIAHYEHWFAVTDQALLNRYRLIILRLGQVILFECAWSNVSAYIAHYEIGRSVCRVTYFVPVYTPIYTTYSSMQNYQSNGIPSA